MLEVKTYMLTIRAPGEALFLKDQYPGPKEGAHHVKDVVVILLTWDCGKRIRN